MIRIICLNPVIDRVYYISDFVEAKKYYEIRPQIFVGGKGINIARVMSQMGEKCSLYAFVGGENGKLIEKEMKTCGVEMKAFRTDGETRTTINIIDNARRQETEITEPGVMINQESQREFLDTLQNDIRKGDMVICSGIPMQGMQNNIYAQISNICLNNECKCILDATGIYLKEAFPGKYYFAKPNFSELSELFQYTGENNLAGILECGKKMQLLGAENVLVSMGHEGGLFLGKNSCMKVIIPKAEVISTIGSGDATVAGFCIGVNREMPVEDCIRLSMACGISNAECSKVGNVDPKRVWEYYHQIDLSYLDM